MNSRHQKGSKRSYVTNRVEVKLDSCGSVSIGHSSLLTNIKSCKEYQAHNVLEQVLVQASHRQVRQRFVSEGHRSI
jgi:hypothetical protein